MNKAPNSAKEFFSPSEVKKWAVDDFNNTISWLESQEEKVRGHLLAQFYLPAEIHRYISINCASSLNSLFLHSMKRFYKESVPVMDKIATIVNFSNDYMCLCLI